MEGVVSWMKGGKLVTISMYPRERGLGIGGCTLTLRLAQGS
jgi:hypothetical protein